MFLFSELPISSRDLQAQVVKIEKYGKSSNIISMIDLFYSKSQYWLVFVNTMYMVAPFR